MTTTACLAQVLPGAQYCSYRVGGPLAQAYLPTTLDEARWVLDHALTPDAPLAVLGGGSNTMIASAGVAGVILISKRLSEIEWMDATHVRIGAGMPLAKVCYQMQQRQLSGCEFMIGVPGTLGGAVAMNAGAIGQETAPVVDKVWLYDRTQQAVVTWTRSELDFSYRHSAINPNHHVILAVQLVLVPGDADAIAALIEKNLTFRQTHHPKEPNGGSVFKNPHPDYPIGRMIDELGGKGWQEGQACISPMHANFIVNLGGATSTDILRLMCRMKRAIKERYGFDVTPENRYIGDATPEEQDLWKELTHADKQHDHA